MNILKKLLAKWFVQSETFVPGQRVRLVGDAPNAKVLKAMQETKVQGTVLSVGFPHHTDFDNMVNVKYDDGLGIYWTEADSLSSVTHDLNYWKTPAEIFNPLPPDPTEEEAKAGLDVSRYRGKWNSAKREATRRGLKGKDYWIAVRVIFIELGGAYTQK